MALSSHSSFEKGAQNILVIIPRHVQNRGRSFKLALLLALVVLVVVVVVVLVLVLYAAKHATRESRFSTTLARIMYRSLKPEESSHGLDRSGA